MEYLSWRAWGSR
ncbi:hypothetical protein S307_19810 [Salmonella enterica subsp. enterica]|nr:hypothetical protein [Salmonella enterica]EBP3978459.1 hypothetical protein [Salmonella enterica subsp. enterica]EBP7423957.1 hypothetical protein [Salmonella enterica]EDT6415967.1 hypothetical protein [Salmonella enterica subsp. enterica]EEP2126994.1 hypothetical protein [Salmonella enterica]